MTIAQCYYSCNFCRVLFANHHTNSAKHMAMKPGATKLADLIPYKRTLIR